MNRHAIALIVLIASLGCQRASSSKEYKSRGECLDVAECVSVDSGTLHFDETQNPLENQIVLSCPVDHPYYRNWGIERGLGVYAWLAQVVFPENSGDVSTVTIAYAPSAAVNESRTIRFFVACAPAPATQDEMLNSQPLHDDSSAAQPEQAYDVPLPPSLSRPGDLTNPVGKQVWSELTKVSDPQGKFLGVTYQLSRDNAALQPKDFLQTPGPAVWGSSGSEWIYSGSSDCKSDDNCDPVFNLKRCGDSTDCSDYQPNQCVPISASVTQPGQDATWMCRRTQDVLWEAIYEIMVTGKVAVDLSSLDMPATGRFHFAIKNALTYLAHTGDPVTVRLIFGNNIGNPSQPIESLLHDITADADQVAGSKLKVYAAAYWAWDMTHLSFNHSKIVAADGARGLIGGQNLYDSDYLSANPAFDMTLRITGSAAYDSQKFLDRLWAYTCANADYSYLSQTYSYSYDATLADDLRYAKGCLASAPLGERPDSAGGTAIIGVGRLSRGIAEGADQSEVAILQMLLAARSTIRLSQQSLVVPLPGIQYPPGPWNYISEAYFDMLAAKLLSGAHVYVVVSNPGAIAGRDSKGGAYDSLPPEGIGWIFRNFLYKKARGHPSEWYNQILCQQLHLSTMTFSDTMDVWPSNGAAISNHSKIVITDDQAFYVGSHNFYFQNNLTQYQEYGLIITDQTVTQQFISSLWDKEWSYSRRRAVSGSDAPGCMFQ